jgi:hypothetical protein
MFQDCTALAVAPDIAAVTVAKNCYVGMFTNCASLVSAPILSATSLAVGCYSEMFMGCSSLAEAPELPALTLITDCYKRMFKGCSKLSYIKTMFTTAPSTSYTSDWVNGVKATGTFVKNSAASWNVTGNNGIPTGWTVETADA